MTIAYEEQGALILAAEDCPPEQFGKYHSFSGYEERLVRSLMAHGPVLIRGGRGSGKSALLMEAHRRLSENNEGVQSVYLSLRHLPLLRSKGAEYERIFCELLVRHVQQTLMGKDVDFSPAPQVGEVQAGLAHLASLLEKRIVLFFDDAAHLGRETALTEFFDIFRTLSSSSVSCKAAIYPGVTKFGIRFDVYNDATVLELSRDERTQGFSSFFLDVMKGRYPSLIDKVQGGGSVNELELAGFLGRAVVGNMRAFIFACNWLSEQQKITLPEVTDCLLYLSADYYWPLLDELTPKLGVYAPLIEPSREIAERMFKQAGSTKAVSVIIHRDWMQRLSKPIEILEYAGFIAKREASRALKSGGRGARFKLNLCTLLETTPGSRVTAEQFAAWIGDAGEFAEVNRGSSLLDVDVPALHEVADLAIFSCDISCLQKSRAYPYGLTEQKVAVLRDNGIVTVGDLAEASDEDLLKIYSIGEAFLQRIKNVVGQAVWM